MRAGAVIRSNTVFAFDSIFFQQKNKIAEYVQLKNKFKNTENDLRCTYKYETIYTENDLRCTL